MKKEMRLFFFCILFVFVGIATYAQGRYTIKSKILDEKQTPLPSVSVSEVGTANGIVSDMDGNFVLKVASETSKVKISFIGYKTIELPANKVPATIILNEDEKLLSDVVVVGYGSLRKSDVTGAVSSISNNDFNKGATTNPLQQIAGKSAGVSISQAGSEPGTSPNIRIRGITSLIGGSDPLVVVDGIQGNLDLLNQLPPNEIESFDILKDASATAIYGSRGAAGVVLVTTKKSKADTFSIEYNGTVSVDLTSNHLDLFNADEWREQSKKWNVPSSADKGGNTNWYNLLTRTGYIQNHSISMGGGTNSFNYRASLSAILQNGLVICSNNNNYIGRFQATQKAFNDRLVLTANLSGGTIKNIGSPQSIGRAAFTSNLISNAYVSRPTDPVYNNDGSYFSDSNVFQYINPYAVAKTVVNEQTTNNLFGSFRADLEIVKGLTAGWFGSWRKVDSNSGYYLPAKSTVTSAIDNNGIANINNSHTDERLSDISLNYKKEFGKHNINAIAVYEWQRQTYNGNYTQMKGFINDITTFNALQLGDYSKINSGDISSYKNDRTLISFLGRINYSYLNRYLLTASIRRDGSSVFGADNKWGNFPSASIAWVVSEEPFMQNINFLSNLKLRAGYGVTGNQQGLNPQCSLNLVGTSGQTYFGGNQITNYSISQNSNPDLRWETRAQTNIGLDFAMFNSRLSGSIDLYTAKTKNLLFNYTVPQPPYPYGSVVANVGSLSNKGLDMNLNVHVFKSKDMNVSINGNLSLLQNKVLNLNGSINNIPLNTDYVSWGTNSYLIKGKPIGTFYILKHEGKTSANEETVVDQDKNGSIDTGNTSKDRFIEGSALPKYTYAFSPTFNYKNFDASILFRGSGGNKIYNSIKSSFSYFENLGKSNLLRSAVSTGLYTSKYASDLWLEDGSFLRLDNVTLGYRFDVKSIKNISALRLSVTATNLALFTKYKGLDPELNFGGGNGFGADNGIYPRTRSISIGLNVVFK
jgi:TonB-linked outer membrane protein, SusC/RagA family